MMNIGSKKNKKNELTEAQLDNVVGGATFFDAEEDETFTEEIIILPSDGAVGMSGPNAPE